MPSATFEPLGAGEARLSLTWIAATETFGSGSQFLRTPRLGARRQRRSAHKSLFRKQRLILRRLLRRAKGLEGCSRRRRTAPSGTSFEAASRRLRTREPAFGSGANSAQSRDRRRSPHVLLAKRQADGDGTPSQSRRLATRAWLERRPAPERRPCRARKRRGGGRSRRA